MSDDFSETPYGEGHYEGPALFSSRNAFPPAQQMRLATWCWNGRGVSLFIECPEGTPPGFIERLQEWLEQQR